MRLVVGTAAVALALFSGGCSSEEAGSGCPADGCDVAEVGSLPYTSQESTKTMAKVIAPEQDGAWPVVIVAHGSGAGPDNVGAWADGIAAQGALVYNVDWPEFGTGTRESAEALTCAVQVAVADAANRGADTSRVVFVGHSLGASVGAAVSLGGASAAPGCTVTDGDVLPDAFVGYEGPYDEARVDYLLDFSPRDQRGDEASDPYAHIGSNPDLVLRLVHGDAPDTQFFDTPLRVSEDFAQALEEAGYDVDLIVVEGANHTNIHVGTDVQKAIVDQVGDVLGAL